MDLDGAKQSPLGLVLSRFEQVIHSLALVPLKSASRASISSSEPSAFSITLRPPDLLVGTKEVSFPRLWVKDTRLFSTKISREVGGGFQTEQRPNRDLEQMRRKYIQVEVNKS